MYGASELCDLLEGKKGDPKDPLRVIPSVGIGDIRATGAAAIDLRLGRWFLVFRHSRNEVLDVLKEAGAAKEGALQKIAKSVFVPFGEKFVLHVGKFVLGTTLEWIRVPATAAGYVTGKSSWGRRGLVIETAAGIHPGFSGCLTLEIGNLGEVTINLYPGMPICQIFLHAATGATKQADSKFLGLRRPVITSMQLDTIAKRLARPI
jgi:dCTP deaminase